MDAEEVLDWLAESVRIYGEHAFDVMDVSREQTHERCETWARHLLLGVTPPNRESSESDGSSDRGTAVDDPGNQPRDWPGLRLFLSSHRQDESEYVRESQTNLREAIWAFISGIRRSMLRDLTADDPVNHRIHRLEGADDHEAIKWKAHETIGLLTQLMSQRQEQHSTEMQGLAARLERMRGQLDAVREEAATDSLTRLFNRSAFDEQLQRASDFGSLFEKPSYLVMLDIDHFKWVNDNHGHPGGEEFAVLLRDGDLATAAMLAERALMAIRELEIEWHGEPVRVTASAGLAQLRQGETTEEWLERTDRALYAAKQAGRDQIVVDSSQPPAESD